MKEILVIVRMNRMNETKRALADVGIPSFTARKVMGRGQGKVDYLLLKGAEEGYEEAINQLGPGPKLVPKRMLTIVAPDGLVEKAVDVVIRTNQTGNPGDGKIFILPVSDATRIRTGETGDAILDEGAA